MASIIGVQELQHTNGTSAATIDSSGRILTPTRPAFKAISNTTQSITNATHTKMEWNATSWDIGSNFSTANNEFTAPIDGIYDFDVLVRVTATVNTIDLITIKLQIVGTTSYDVDLLQLNPIANNLLNSHVGGGTQLKLEANDKVSVSVRVDGTSPTIGSDDGQYNWFCGHLVG